MENHNIEDYRVRSSYSNYNTINFFVQNASKSNELIDNYRSPEVEYIEKGCSDAKCIPADFLDLTFLCDKDAENGKGYLRQLIRFLEGDEESTEFILQKREAYKTEKQTLIKTISFVENEYVVPSSTMNNYSETQISHKGSILLNLSQKLFPVPDFCVLTSNTFFASPQEKESHLKNAVENLEKMTGMKFGDANNPLVFAMRSATSFYIPGFLPTYLNVGINETVYNALKRKYGAVVAGKIYVNNLQTIYKVLFPDDIENPICDPITSGCMLEDIETKIAVLFDLIARYDREILTDVFAQTLFLVDKMYEFFNRNQDLVYTLKKGDISYPSIIMQKMVWTIRNDDSYPGVLYSRHSRTGLGMQIESAINMFGDDIMTGCIDRTDTEFFEREEIKNTFPAVYHFAPSLSKLEKIVESPVTIEFAAETRKKAYLFAILQLNVSELTGRSILLSAIDLYEKGIISSDRVIKLIQPYHLKQIFSECIDDHSFQRLSFFCNGISVLPRSAVSARIFFSTAKALEAKRNGEKVCLCKETYIPSDTIILGELDAILSLTPAAVHVVTSCLGYGVPAFINLQKYHVKLRNQSLENSEGLVLKEGDWITISSRRRIVYLGKADFAPARFQKYIEGKTLDLQPKEEKVFIKMKKAYDQYQTILKTLDCHEIETLNDLIKIIRNDLQKNQEKARNLANSWLDSNMELYIDQVLKSELGTHKDQHMIYNLFTNDRKILFFKAMIKICYQKGLQGYNAGSFMLGRFICLYHPVAFWQEMDRSEIAFLLNEYILFEKYLQVLNDLGERHINRVRRKILSDGINGISLSHIDPTVFVTVKFVFKDWETLKEEYAQSLDSGTLYLIDLLKRPFNYIYDYKMEWSLNRLKEICEKENIPLPDAFSV
jgi:hypothetical protein